MAIMLRPMTGEEFDAFYKWSAEHQANELIDELHMSRDEAVREALAELAGMLPDGLHTADNYLMTIADAGSGGSVGFIWTLHEETDGRRQSFICDFAIWEPMRRRGYAAEALRLTERYAAGAGCHESVLFVSDDNLAARALYEKCGYEALRPESYGRYMIKRLT